MNRMVLSSRRLLQYAHEGKDVLNRIVTGDESWLHYNQPDSKSASTQWKHPSSPSTKRFKVMSTPSAGKIVLTGYRNSQRVLLAHFRMQRTVKFC
jgi:hypothetical protein